MKKSILKYKPMKTIKVTSFFGRRSLNVSGSSKIHKALDLGGSSMSIYAVAPGTIVANGYHAVRGWYAELKINKTTTVFYQHMARRCKWKKGTGLKAGARIGTKGSSGLKGIAPHLHLEIRVNGTPVDPLPYFIASYKSVEIKHNIKQMKSNTDSVWVLEVKRLQEILKKMRLYKGTVDGKPEKRTDEAIRAFQRKYSLKADGTFGPACRRKLHELGYR